MEEGISIFTSMAVDRSARYKTLRVPTSSHTDFFADIRRFDRTSTTQYL